MAIINPFPTIISNGQVEDATVVMTLFNWIMTNVNGNATPATTGTNILKGDGAGGTIAAAAGIDYATGPQALGTLAYCGTATGTANALVLTPGIPVLAYAPGESLTFLAGFNSIAGGVTVNVSTLGVIPITKRTSGGLVALVANDIVAGMEYRITNSSSGNYVLDYARTYSQGAIVASAATVVLDNTTGDYVHISGTTTITAITLAQGEERSIIFDGILTLTNSASLMVPSNANITTAAGDYAVFRGEAAGIVRCVAYLPDSGLAVVSPVLTSKIQSVTAVQSGGNLTFAINPTALDFRPTNLTSGVNSTVSLAAQTLLTLPSGGTLGFPTTVQGRIVEIAINNAGVIEPAVIALAGGNILDETGLISTTAISAAATANNVFYSTTARTSVAYRVVGFVDAVNTAGAWGNPVLVQGAGGQALQHTGAILNGVTQNTTAGTSIDFTGIPPWAKRVTVMFNGVGTSGASPVQIQVGAGSVVSTGYISYIGTAGGTTSATITTGFAASDQSSGSSSWLRNGILMLTNNTGNLWSQSLSGGFYNGSTPYGVSGAGNITLSGNLDRIRLTTITGTDTFARGTINILFE